MIRIAAVVKSHTPSGSPRVDRHPIAIKNLTFPGGETHVTLAVDVPADELEVRAHLPNAEAVMMLLMATDALRRAYPGLPIDLYLPYVPYARQDRVANPGESLSAKVFCDLVNAQAYRRVVIQDPHSDVVPALLERVVIEDPLPALSRAAESIYARTGSKAFALVAPDAGARKRVMKLAQALGTAVVFADKVRDTRTGAITGTEIHGELPECPLLVTDDICDGGRTFTELAAALSSKQRDRAMNQPLFLYVTHGIFSKGLDALLDHYAAVFTRNNWTDDKRAVLV